MWKHFRGDALTLLFCCVVLLFHVARLEVLAGSQDSKSTRNISASDNEETNGNRSCHSNSSNRNITQLYSSPLLPLQGHASKPSDERASRRTREAEQDVGDSTPSPLKSTVASICFENITVQANSGEVCFCVAFYN